MMNALLGKSSNNVFIHQMKWQQKCVYVKNELLKNLVACCYGACDRQNEVAHLEELVVYKLHCLGLNPVTMETLVICWEVKQLL